MYLRCTSSESPGNSIVALVILWRGVSSDQLSVINCFLSNAPIAFETFITLLKGSFLCLTLTWKIENLHRHHNTSFFKRFPCDIPKCNDFNIVVWTQKILNAVVQDVWCHCLFTGTCLVVFFCILSATEGGQFSLPLLFLLVASL